MAAEEFRRAFSIHDARFFHNCAFVQILASAQMQPAVAASGVMLIVETRLQPQNLRVIPQVIASGVTHPSM